MAAPSYTYTLTNGTTADADQVQQNFNDILNGVTDSTKDLSINALTCAGAATLNGNVTLGNGSADDITVTGSLASTIPIKTTASYNIGSSSLGLAGIYFGANSQTVRIIGSGSMAATWTLTLPTNVGTAGQFLKEGGSGVTAWQWPNGTTSAKTADYTVTDTDGIEVILMTTGGTDRTVTLPTAADNTYRKIKVVKVDNGSGKVTIDGEGAETINGATTVKIPGYEAGQWCYIEVTCDGSGWYITDIKDETEWISWTPSTTWNNGNTTWTGYYKRVKDDIICNVNGVQAGAPSAAALAVTLPNSWTIATGKIPGTPANNTTLGTIHVFDSGTQDYTGFVQYNTTTAVSLVIGKCDGTYFYGATVTNLVPMTFTTNDEVDAFFRVPITEFAL